MGGGFDLRVEPWIAVRLLTGEPARVGLWESFQRAHEIEDLEIPVPPAAAGLLRILAPIAARIATDGGDRLDDPDVAEDIDDWFGLRERVLKAGRFQPQAVDAYFDREDLADRFDLFHPVRPFLQDPRLRAECVDGTGAPNPSGVNKLVMGRPTGVNGAVLFGHFADIAPVPVPAAEAAWHLIAQLYYGPSGQCTPRRITGERAGSGDAAPLRKSVSYFPWGTDLFTTLVLAVPSPQTEVDWDTEDACPWEEDLNAPLKPLPPITWPGRMLTGRFRHAALLVPSDDGREPTSPGRRTSRRTRSATPVGLRRADPVLAGRGNHVLAAHHPRAHRTGSRQTVRRCSPCRARRGHRTGQPGRHPRGCAPGTGPAASFSHCCSRPPRADPGRPRHSRCPSPPFPAYQGRLMTDSMPAASAPPTTSTVRVSDRFVRYIHRLCESNQARAALRRGLGLPATTCTATWCHGYATTTTSTMLMSASTGRTRPGPDVRDEGSEHPRVGGEESETPPKGLSTGRTLPRRRGGRSGWVRAPVGGRSTPASAGRTAPPSARSGCRAEHPRVGGEDSCRRS